MIRATLICARELVDGERIYAIRRFQDLEDRWNVSELGQGSIDKAVVQVTFRNDTPVADVVAVLSDPFIERIHSEIVTDELKPEENTTPAFQLHDPDGTPDPGEFDAAGTLSTIPYVSGTRREYGQLIIDSL